MAMTVLHKGITGGSAREAINANFSALAARSPISVTECGAKGDGITDDSTAIQAALDRAGATATASAVIFPAGAYRIAKPLKIERMRSLTLIGVGHGGDWKRRVERGYAGRMAQSVLFWDGPDGGTLLELSGASFVGIAALDFEGKDPTSRSKTAALIHLTDYAGWATGNIYLERVSLQHATSGIQAGSAIGDRNCSDISGTHIHGNNLGNLLLVKHNQGVNYDFRYVVAGDVGSIFNFERGGSLRASMVTGAGCDWLLNAGAGGVNVGMFCFESVLIEWPKPLGSKRAGLIYTDPAADYTVNSIIDLRGVIATAEVGEDGLTPAAGTYLIEAHRGIQVLVTSSRFSARDVVNASGIDSDHPSSVTFRHTQFHSSNPVFAEWFTQGQHSSVVAQDCYDANGRKINLP